MTDCPNHLQHESRIERLERDYLAHQKDSNEVREKLYKAIDDLKEDMQTRLPIWVTFTISFLMSIAASLTVFVATIVKTKG